jgi:hypothetical protein
VPQRLRQAGAGEPDKKRLRQDAATKRPAGAGEAHKKRLRQEVAPTRSGSPQEPLLVQHVRGETREVNAVTTRCEMIHAERKRGGGAGGGEERKGREETRKVNGVTTRCYEKAIGERERERKRERDARERERERERDATTRSCDTMIVERRS